MKALLEKQLKCFMSILEFTRISNSEIQIVNFELKEKYE